jgi:hypothetical protein
VPQPGFDVPDAHRWFAVEYNNQAWDIVEGTDRSPDAIARLLDYAHAACLHWSAIGTVLNRQRALDLLAHAYAAAGIGELALRFARQALELCESNDAEQTPFDRAQAAATMAVALAVAGQNTEAEQWKHKAQSAAELLEIEEQETIRRLLPRDTSKV